MQESIPGQYGGGKGIDIFAIDEIGQLWVIEVSRGTPRGAARFKGGGKPVKYAGNKLQMSAEWRVSATQKFLNEMPDAAEKLRHLLHDDRSSDQQIKQRFSMMNSPRQVGPQQKSNRSLLEFPSSLPRTSGRRATLHPPRLVGLAGDAAPSEEGGALLSRSSSSADAAIPGHAEKFGEFLVGILTRHAHAIRLRQVSEHTLADVLGRLK